MLINLVVFDYIFHLRIFKTIFNFVFGLLLVLLCYTIFVYLKTRELIVFLYHQYYRYKKIHMHRDICAICMDELNNDNYVKLQCTHEFHKHCIDSWFKIKLTCPNCRVLAN